MYGIQSSGYLRVNGRAEILWRWWNTSVPSLILGERIRWFHFHGEKLGLNVLRGRAEQGCDLSDLAREEPGVSGP
jgi:hypothetical protein